MSVWRNLCMEIIPTSISHWNQKVWNGPCLLDCHDQIVTRGEASHERRAISRSQENKWLMQRVVLSGLQAHLVGLYVLSTWRRLLSLVLRPQRTLHSLDRHLTGRQWWKNNWLPQSLSIWTYLWALATSWSETTIEIQIQTYSRVYAAPI